MISKLDQLKALGAAKRAARKSSDGSVVSKHAVQNSGMDQSARPSPMGSRSCDVKTTASGVARVAPGPSEANSAHEVRRAAEPAVPSCPQAMQSPPEETGDMAGPIKRGRPKFKGPRPWETAGMSRRTYYRRKKERS